MNHTYNSLVVLHDMEHVCGTYYGRRIQSICCRIPYGCKLLLHHPPVKGIMPHEYTSRVREKIPGAWPLGEETRSPEIIKYHLE